MFILCNKGEEKEPYFLSSSYAVSVIPTPLKTFRRTDRLFFLDLCKKIFQFVHILLSECLKLACTNLNTINGKLITRK